MDLAEPTADLLGLHKAAQSAASAAYQPHSGIAIGAAVRVASDGEVYVGANVENDSFGLTNCAERSAIFSAVTAGHRLFDAAAIAGPLRSLPPCGACRQVLAQFGAGSMPIVFPFEGRLVSATIGELLPLAFGLERPSTDRL